MASLAASRAEDMPEVVISTSMRYELNDVIVTSFQNTGTARTSEDIQDAVTFAYKSMKIEWTSAHFKSTATLMN